jgi:transposase
MALGKRSSKAQAEMWIDPDELPRAPSHPFYQRLNQILAAADVDRQVEELAAPYYAGKVGRPSMPPSVYVRLLLIGYFEGIGSDRGIAWRVADSMALRQFVGYRLTERTPDHSTISRTRRRLPMEFHEDVFALVIELLEREGLIDGKTIGVDGSTMEANAALRSIVRRDSGQQYQEYLEQLARASGIESPTREDLARIDKKRKKKGSNQDWENPHDPDAKITKMKDGRTHLAHKVENAVDMKTGVILGAEIHPADQGDTQTFPKTLERAVTNVDALIEAGADVKPVTEVVADKGSHSGGVLTGLADQGLRTYISEPNRGQRKWSTGRGKKSDAKAREQQLTYANRRRVSGDRGQGLLRRRGELLERTFAHVLDSGGIRRTTLRGRENIKKRYLLQAASFNLSLILRKLLGAGKPRWAAALTALYQAICAALRFAGDGIRDLARHAVDRLNIAINRDRESRFADSRAWWVKIRDLDPL